MSLSNRLKYLVAGVLLFLVTGCQQGGRNEQGNQKETVAKHTFDNHSSFYRGRVTECDSAGIVKLDFQYQTRRFQLQAGKRYYAFFAPGDLMTRTEEFDIYFATAKVASVNHPTATIQLAADAHHYLKKNHRLVVLETSADEQDVLKEMTEIVPFTFLNSSPREFLEFRDRILMKSNLKSIGLAFHNYHDTYRRLPPAVIYGPDGKPWHSWRVLILPFIEQNALYERYRFDEPWNGPNNKKLHEQLPFVFQVPGHPDQFSKPDGCNQFVESTCSYRFPK